MQLNWFFGRGQRGRLRSQHEDAHIIFHWFGNAGDSFLITVESQHISLIAPSLRILQSSPPISISSQQRICFGWTVATGRVSS